MSANLVILFCAFLGTDVEVVTLGDKIEQPYAVVLSSGPAIRTARVRCIGKKPIVFALPDAMFIEVVPEGVVLSHPNFMGTMVLFHESDTGCTAWKGAVILRKFSGEEEIVGVREIASSEALQDAIDRLVRDY